MPALDAILIGLTIVLGVLVIIGIERRHRADRRARRRAVTPAVAPVSEPPSPTTARPAPAQPNRLVVSAPRRTVVASGPHPGPAPAVARRSDTAWFVRTTVFATVAVLSVIASAVLVLQPPPSGGVLGATGTPAPSVSSTPSGNPSPSPTRSP